MKKLVVIFFIVLGVKFSYSQVTVTSTNITDGPNYLVKWNTLNSTQAKIVKSRIFDNGTNIGLATTSPAYFLTLNGDAERTIGVERILLSTSGGSSLTLQAGGGHISYNNMNGGDLILKSGVTTGTGVSNILFFTPPKTTQSGNTDNNPVERMRISADGNVGIGTNNNTITINGQAITYKLAVNGSIIAENLRIVANVPASDYVFGSSYKLRNLSDVELYVKENKHLPEVPSAIEFQENGYSVGQMDDILLRKVEELTLYLIEQNKRIEALEAENIELKK